MNDEHPELGHVEMANGMRNLAEMGRTLYLESLEQGFTETDALRITLAYLHGLAGGKLS